ncbi:hypothetical protein [Chromobacterium vaccinii]|uniref:hypothetical protein n=1 Tax=Chromobacterium vaccinii TaxID=1108595 RepID=UPI0011AB4D0D|nr:hypothetical protein [Chromobacterium vaccinii]
MHASACIFIIHIMKLLNIINPLSAFCSIIGLIYSILTSTINGGSAVFFGITIGIALLTGAATAFQEWKTGPKKFNKSNIRGINQYLSSWIEHSGKIVISTNDLSWGNGDALEILRSKAQSGDLTIIAPAKTNKLQELANEGASILLYKSPSIATRFTFIDYGKNTARVAIADADNNGSKHIIWTHKSGDEQFTLTDDIVKIAKQAGEQLNAESK